MNEQWKYFLHRSTGIVMKAEYKPMGSGWVEISKEEYYRRIDGQDKEDAQS